MKKIPIDREVFENYMEHGRREQPIRMTNVKEVAGGIKRRTFEPNPVEIKVSIVPYAGGFEAMVEVGKAKHVFAKGNLLEVWDKLATITEMGALPKDWERADTPKPYYPPTMDGHAAEARAQALGRLERINAQGDNTGVPGS